MCNYWLHILKDEPHVESCTLALSVSPCERDVDGTRLQTVHYKSWQQLSAALSKVGIGYELLQRAKFTLDSAGLETLREIPLSPEQLGVLGFKEIH